MQLFVSDQGVKLMAVAIPGHLLEQIRQLGKLLATKSGEMLQIASCPSLQDAWSILKLDPHSVIVAQSSEANIDECLLFLEQINTANRNQETSVIFYSGETSGEESRSLSLLRRGADDFLRTNSDVQEVIIRIEKTLAIRKTMLRLEAANRRLETLSITDELTGLANMRHFNSRYMEALNRCRTGASSLGIIMLDLDNFKVINDTINHATGSYVIQEVGKGIGKSNSLAATDFPARFGGDEFIILCPGDQLSDLSLKADWLRHEIRSRIISKDEYRIRITSSVGAAWAPAGSKVETESLIRAADAMLYASKDKGRDQVSAIALGYAIDLNHISRADLINWDAGRYNNRRTGTD